MKIATSTAINGVVQAECVDARDYQLAMAEAVYAGHDDTDDFSDDWDAQIERASDAGVFDVMIREAHEDFEAGRCREL